MALSAEERRGLLEDAADPRRREVLRRFRHPRQVLSPDELLIALRSTSELLVRFRVARHDLLHDRSGKYLL